MLLKRSASLHCEMRGAVCVLSNQRALHGFWMVKMINGVVRTQLMFCVKDWEVRILGMCENHCWTLKKDNSKIPLTCWALCLARLLTRTSHWRKTEKVYMPDRKAVSLVEKNKTKLQTINVTHTCNMMTDSITPLLLINRAVSCILSYINTFIMF